MNIGLFSDCYLPTRNGVSQAVRHLKEGLEERGHRVLLVTVSDPDRESEPSSVYTLPSLPFKPSLRLRVGLITAGAVRRLIMREGLDLIHTHTEFAVGRAGRKAGTMLQIPMVHTFHTFYEEYLHFIPFGRALPKESIKPLMSRFLRPFQAVICPSRKSQEYLRRTLPRDNTVLIPNGIPLSPTAGLQGDGSQPDDDPTDGMARPDRTDKNVILSVGRLSPEKRSLQLVSWLVPLLYNRSDIELILVGDGPLRRSIQHTIHLRGLDNRIFLTGSLSHEKVQTLYETADLFITASLSENHPLSLLEAAAAGLPLIVRDDPGGLDMVRDGINGFRTEADEQLPNAVMRLLDTPGLRGEFSRNSRTIAREFSKGLQAARMEDLYFHCLGTSPEHYSAVTMLTGERR